MRGKISVCIILAIGFLIFLIYGSSTIYGMRNDVIANEETIIGDVNAVSGVNIEVKYQDNNDIGWDINYQIENNIQMSATFKTFYYNNYSNNFAPSVHLGTDMGLYREEYFGQIEGDVGEITISLADKYEYMPINLFVSFDKSSSKGLLGENNIYKIKMPEDAVLHIKKEYNSYSSEPINVPYIDARPPSVLIDGKMYLTITNFLNQIYYEKSSEDNIEYTITSGILAIEDKERLSLDDIEMIYPIHLANGGTTTVLGLTSVKEEKFLALATLEEQNIYIHLYDVKNNVLVKKEKVGSIPANMIINQFNLITQGDYLLANYVYDRKEETDSRDTLKAVGAAYNITDTNEIKNVFENEYYTKLAKEINEHYYTEPQDMLFKDNKLHMVFYNSNNDYYGRDRLNSIVLLTMDKEEIQYFGILRNSMIEDYTIGDVYQFQYTTNGDRLIIGNRARNIYSFHFVK